MRAKAISAVFCVLIFLVLELGGGPVLAAPVYVLLTTFPIPPSAVIAWAGRLPPTTLLMSTAPRS